MLLFAEGFDGITNASSTGSPLYETSLFDYVNATYANWGTAYGRLAAGVQLGNHPCIAKSISMSGATIILGVAVKKTATRYTTDGNYYNEFITFFSGGVGATKQITLTWDGDEEKLQVRSGSYNGTVLVTSSNTFTQGQWYYVEVKITFNSSTGSVELKVNGTSVGTASSVNTDPAAATSCDYIEFGSYGSYNATNIDDIYICDASGSYNTDFLGDVYVECLAPTSDGADQDFTLSTGTDGYALVDDIPASDTDYVEGDAIGERFSIGVTASNDGRDIYGVVVNELDINTDVGTLGAKLFGNYNSTESQSAEFTVGSSANRRFFVLEREPAASAAWTYTILNASEFGVEITS